MKYFLIPILIITGNVIIAQPKSNCRIDIYLVKNYVRCWDTVTKKIVPFNVTIDNLQDTAFIKDEEIILYTFKKFKQKIRIWGSRRRKKITARLHSLQLSSSVNDRIDSLSLSLFGCAAQFAIVCDGEIIYGGCLNNHMSSWVPPVVTLTGRDNEIHFGLWPGIAPTDPRENPKLFDCLKKTGRFKFQKKYADD